jgi:hypothetical protein
MQTEALFPDAPAVVVDGNRQFVTVPWDAADALRAALAKHGCPTTLCLDPETRQARLELWPGVTPEAVRALLDACGNGRPGTTTGPTTVRVRDKTPEPAESICV